MLNMKISRTLALAPVLATCLTAWAHAAPLQEGEFTRHVATLLQKEVGADRVVVAGPLTLTLGPLQANLDRIHAFCQRNADGCDDEVAQYVKAAAQVHKDQTAPPDKDMVRLVIRSKQYVDVAQSSIGGDKPPQILARPFLEGLVTLSVLDSPRTIKMLSPSDCETLKLTAQEAHELGLANLRKAQKPILDVAKPAGRGQIGRITGDSYHPSRLLFVDSWAPLAREQGGVLIVAIPTTDAVLYVAEDSDASVDALRSLVARVQQQAPNRLSDALFRWRESGWELVR